MDGSLSVWIVVISMVGIVSVEGLFVEQGFEFLEKKLKCFQRV